VPPGSEKRARAAVGVTHPYLPMRSSGAIVAAEPDMSVSDGTSDVSCEVPAERR
jgi:hypothetical protein